MKQESTASQAIHQETGALRQFATFYINDAYFGIDILQVQEILRHQEMSPVPLAPKVIAGLINLRGQIVTGFNLRQRLELGAAKTPEPIWATDTTHSSESTPANDATQSKAMNIVVKTEDGAVSLLVDDIGDVLSIESSQFEAAPDTVPAHLRSMLECICKLDGKLLLILDSAKALDFAPTA